MNKFPKQNTNYILAIYLYFALRFEGSKQKIKEGLYLLKDYLSQEKEETKIMLDIYLRYNQGKASKDELKKANKQLRDILKSIGLGFLLILPFSPITLPVIIKLGEKFGFKILPDYFDETKEKS